MRGILMIEPLYHQTVAGLKTQTRRSGGLEQINGRKAVVKNGVVVKPAIISDPDIWLKGDYGLEFTESGTNVTSCSFAMRYLNSNTHVHAATWINLKPRYHVGEVLYIKEPVSIRYVKDSKDWEVIYKYGKTESGWPTMSGKYVVPELHGNPEPLWENKLFMKADYARAYVRITGIRCERLLDISDDDCLAEGIELRYYGEEGAWYKDYLNPGNASRAKPSFISLYKFANKVKEVPNLWVWCYTFEYLKDYGS